MIILLLVLGVPDLAPLPAIGHLEATSQVTDSGKCLESQKKVSFLIIVRISVNLDGLGKKKKSCVVYCEFSFLFFFFLNSETMQIRICEDFESLLYPGL